MGGCRGAVGSESPRWLSRLTRVGSVVRPAYEKTQALLAYLAFEPGRAFPRDGLASLLWGECRGDRARKSLRQAVYALRKALRASPRLQDRIWVGSDIRHLLPRVRVPTLVLHGEDDRIVPVAAGRWVASRIPAAEFYAFKGCGHLPAFSAPEQVARVLRQFLRTGGAA